jgi:glycosyltransferase involved in cell wall biosynthesis
VVSWLTEELVARGHDVTLFASGDSESEAKLVACVPQGLRLSGIRSHLASHAVMLDRVRRRADQFDIIHFHVDVLQHVLFQDMAHKCLTTLHGRLDLLDDHPIYRAFPRMPLVSISENQRLPMPRNVNWLATIPHGLPVTKIAFHSRPGDYLAFLGRIAPEKRPDRAIEIAKRAGIPLKIAAKVDDTDRKYFEERIRPLLHDSSVEFVGEIADTQKDDFLGNALALLFPIDWPEPFGLVMIEAMAAGTPVIAWRNGSVPEVINDGVSGMIVKSISEAVSAIGRIGLLSREAVRHEFETRFTSTRMAQDYTLAYERLLASKTDKRAFARVGRIGCRGSFPWPSELRLAD